MGSVERKRPIRIANCSGARCDSGQFMLDQAKYGPVDVITGDSSAEMNLAANAEKFQCGSHPGYEPTALEGIRLTLDLINENEAVKLAKNTASFVGDRKRIVSAHAYLGARAIRKGLDEGADIIICGRVSDASPVIGAAQRWFGWDETDFDKLAGAFIGGHLIECSAYVTGANFAGFERYPLEELIDIAHPIAEISGNGDSVITKHPGLNGFVTEDTIRCQLLYEIQGIKYLHSDVKADISNVAVEQIGKDRVKVTGTKGQPPPATTKLAVFYRGGFQCEFTCNATGTAFERKWDLKEFSSKINFEVGVPEPNPRSQLKGTSYLRVFAQAQDRETIALLPKALEVNGMQHYSGSYDSKSQELFLVLNRCSPVNGRANTGPSAFSWLLSRNHSPEQIDEQINILGRSTTDGRAETLKIKVGYPTTTEPLGSLGSDLSWFNFINL